MISLIDGDLFAQDVQALVNPCNCVGVAGAGLSLEFKKRWANEYDKYKKYCDDPGMDPNEVLVLSIEYPSFLTTTGPSGYDVSISRKPSILEYIVYFPTKDHWRDLSRLWWIELGLVDLRQQIIDVEIESIAIPALGAGLGELPWEPVKELIRTTLGDLEEVDIRVLQPR